MPKTKSRYLLSKTKSSEDGSRCMPLNYEERENVLHIFMGHIMKMHGEWKLLNHFLFFKT
jgi:hypothetical protein